MKDLTEQKDILKRTNLEMEFSGPISDSMDRVFLFLQTAGISSLSVYPGCDEALLADSLLKFISRAESQNILCSVVVPYDRKEAYRAILQENVKCRFRICSSEELSDFLSKKDDYAGKKAR